jgi:hypothetical protein
MDWAWGGSPQGTLCLEESSTYWFLFNKLWHLNFIYLNSNFAYQRIMSGGGGWGDGDTSLRAARVVPATHSGDVAVRVGLWWWARLRGKAYSCPFTASAYWYTKRLQQERFPMTSIMEEVWLTKRQVCQKLIG